MKHIAIFASGKGTNAQSIIEHFKSHPSVKVALVVTNNPQAGVIKIAHSHKIISAIVSREFMASEDKMLRLLQAQDIELVVLAGFLQLIPSFLLGHFPKRIINIHPALLPMHGGKGMYGLKVHEAVMASKAAETGFTIHYVNEHYDEGEVLLQQKVPVSPFDTAETLSQKVLALEHEWYPKTIEMLITS